MGFFGMEINLADMNVVGTRAGVKIINDGGDEGRRRSCEMVWSMGPNGQVVGLQDKMHYRISFVYSRKKMCSRK